MLLRELRRAGAGEIDLLVLTHAQLDHIGAAPEVLGSVPVANVLDGRDGDRSPLSREIGAALASTQAEVTVVEAGQRIVAGPIGAEVLWPPPGPPPPGGDPNDRAVVLFVEAYGRSVLMTADAESHVLARLPLAEADVLKVSHHGSADPGLPALLARVRPRAALVEVGEGNTYGHPVPATLDALDASGARTWRTDRDGTVALELRADGQLLRAR
jgi:competence protein ComEC